MWFGERLLGNDTALLWFCLHQHEYRHEQLRFLRKQVWHHRQQLRRRILQVRFWISLYAAPIL